MPKTNVKKNSITLLCDHNITQKPRSSRLLQMLCEMKALNLQINIIAKECKSLESLPHLSPYLKLLSFPADKTSKQRNNEENALIQSYCHKGKFEPLIYTPTRLYIRKHLDSLPPQDLLIIEDITLLPFACDYKKLFPHCKILIDLREFYPLEYENDPAWMRGLGRLFAHLCEVYLPHVDYAISVSEGLCERYRKDYGILCEVFYSLPPFFDYTPKPTLTQPIKILYHGFISPDRSSQEMLGLGEMLSESSKKYQLYVMALSNQKGFLEDFTQKVHKIRSLNVLPPVAMQEIIPFSRDFDIGLIPFKPTTFNLTHCMPNKLFEYMQARLAICATPLPDIERFLEQNTCGIVANGFDVSDMMQTLESLTPARIDILKANAHKSAYKWSMQTNQTLVMRIISGLLER